MNRLHLSYAMAVLVLCVAIAKGLDRLIVDPPSKPAALIPVISAPMAPAVAASPVPRKFAAAQEQRIMMASDGHYYTDVAIDGWQLKHVLIDTGATHVALSYEDAANLGIYPGPGDYIYETRTANGVGHVAAVTLREVRLGEIVLNDVQAVVGERGMLDVSLLGMSFLSRLSRVEASENTLALQP